MTTDTTTTTQAATYQVGGTVEQNLYHDSYFYAVTYTPATRSFALVEVGATAYAGWTNLTPAPPEVVAEAHATLVEVITTVNLAKARENRYAPTKGREVTSTTTRGKNVGITGTVMWIGPDRYNPRSERVGIKVEGEDTLRYLPANKVRATTPAEVSYDEIHQRAQVSAGRAVRECGPSWYYALREVDMVRTL